MGERDNRKIQSTGKESRRKECKVEWGLKEDKNITKTKVGSTTDK